MAIFLYEAYHSRRAGSDASLEDHDDISKTVFDVLGECIYNWFTGSKLILWIGPAILSYGAYLASLQGVRSTYFCSSVGGSSFLIFPFQLVGFVLDAAIVIILWRILAWTRTTKSRLQALSSILLGAAFQTGCLYLLYRLWSGPTTSDLRGLDSLYLFEIVAEGLTFATFVTSTAFLAIEGSPLSLVVLGTFISALPLTIQQARYVGTWETLRPASNYTAMALISFGFSFFIYANNVRTVALLHRAFVVILLLVLLVTVAVLGLIRKENKSFEKHPLTKLFYEARVATDRWRVRASISNSVPVAVREYRERYGRDPPANFDIWYEFAKQRKSLVLDDFSQVGADILPFWGMSPEKIRKDIGRLAGVPGIVIISIQDGIPSCHVPASLLRHKPVVDELVDMIRGFSKHLPDMKVALNLLDQPRSLAHWGDVKRFTKAARQRHKNLGKLLPKRAETSNPADEPDAPPPPPPPSDLVLRQQNQPRSIQALRQMTAITCPPGSPLRAGIHWDNRDLCMSCVRPHSRGDHQFLSDWQRAQSVCHQPDLLRLHSFYISPPDYFPFQELLPVFSRSKTDRYNDILIPLNRTRTTKLADDGRDFDKKRKKLFWRGRVAKTPGGKEKADLLYGGHQERLVHMLNNATGPSSSSAAAAGLEEKTTLLLPGVSLDPKKKKFVYEQVPTAEINELLPIDVGFIETADFDEAHAREFGRVGGRGTVAASQAAPAGEQEHYDVHPLAYQYVLVMDPAESSSSSNSDDDGGAPRDVDFVQVLRSRGTAPLYASIFKEWYSERLVPWVHFVPVDVRLHALHSTLAYLMGIRKKSGPLDPVTVNGREVQMLGRPEDGKWVAEQGQRWADQVMRREDAEVYLFRLLLEWGRVCDDGRDEGGFVLPSSL